MNLFPPLCQCGANAETFTPQTENLISLLLTKIVKYLGLGAIFARKFRRIQRKPISDPH